MDEHDEQIAAMQEEISNLYGLVAGLTAEVAALRSAALSGLAIAQDKFKAALDPAVTVVCDELVRQGQDRDTASEDAADTAEPFFALAVQLRQVQDAIMRDPQ